MRWRLKHQVELSLQWGLLQDWRLACRHAETHCQAHHCFHGKGAECLHYKKGQAPRSRHSWAVIGLSQWFYCCFNQIKAMKNAFSMNMLFQAKMRCLPDFILFHQVLFDLAFSCLRPTRYAVLGAASFSHFCWCDIWYFTIPGGSSFESLSFFFLH